MVLADSRIKELIDSGVLDGAVAGKVGPVSYDLTTRAFYTNSGEQTSVNLMPGDSVYVASKETIHLPSNLVARVLLKNSRMRQGLTLDAPLYFPGHATVVYFRVTNISSNELTLGLAHGIAQLTFEDVEGVVEKPYEGAFSDEFEFKGLASYKDVYSGEIRQIEKQKDEIAGIEKRMYANVLALMAIFAAIFSLVNINMQTLAANSAPAMVVVVNLATVGSFAFLAGIIAFIVRQGKKSAWISLWVIAAILVIAAIAVAVITVGASQAAYLSVQL